MNKIIEPWVDFQILKIKAKAELDLLVSEYHKIVKTKEPKRATELELMIINQQTYISRIDTIVNQWRDALTLLAQTYSIKEYEMFITLIIKDTPPNKVKKWSNSECYSFINKCNHQIRSLIERKEQ